MQLLKANKNNILEASKVIKRGGIVAFPTETVYGLGANGLDAYAAAKIFEAKERPSFNPLILHIADKQDLYKICTYDNSIVTKIINEFWPGPLTIVLPKKSIVPDIITAGNNSVAVRMPNHPVALDLIKLAGTPIAAPSANKFGNLSPTTAAHVVKQLGNSVDIILDGGKTEVGVESTIIEIEGEKITLLRPGGLAAEDIEYLTGKKLLKKISTANPVAPGMLPFHYAPTIPLQFFGDVSFDSLKQKKVGAIFFNKINQDYPFASTKILAPNGDLRKAAANLFAYLHQMESERLDLILVEAIEEKGLGTAIMDRLRKAANKYKNF